MISRFIRQRMRDTAVFWSFHHVGANGQPVYDTPVEIQCRWEERISNIIGTDGREVVSKARIFVGEVLNPQGLIYRGCLIDLTDSEKTDPRTVKNAYELIDIKQTPGLIPGDELIVVMI